MYPYNKKNTSNACKLRKEMTPEEKHLWYDFLKRLPFPVKRQYMLENYIVDFYIPSKKIVIEADGRQHSSRENQEEDRKRDEALASLGITVLRYPNHSINNSFSAVAADILQHAGITYSDLKLQA